MPQTAIETVQLYELLKPKLGEQESRSLLGFIEERTIRLVQDEIAKGLVTRHDLNSVRDELGQEIAAVRQELGQEIAAVRQELGQEIAAVRQELGQEIDSVKQELAEVRKEIARLDQRITSLEKELLAFQWQTRLYFLVIAILILLTNPAALDLFARLLGLTRP